MQDDSSIVTIPDEFKKIIGKPDPGTRTYRKYAKEEEISDWFDAVMEICQPEMAVSPGGVSMFAKVSRAGVHKALKEGRLTAFCFHVVEDSRWIKGEKKLGGGKRPYCYIPVSECRAWALRLEKIRDKKTLDTEINGENDWEGKNLDAPKNWKEQMEGQKK
jgi:hypothetical protein